MKGVSKAMVVQAFFTVCTSPLNTRSSTVMPIQSLLLLKAVLSVGTM